MRVPLLCFILTLACRCFASVDITTSSLPNGTFKKPYSVIVNATGGCTPYKWTVVSGTLPAGITAKASSTTTSLAPSGVPTSATTYTPTVQVTACGGGTYKVSYKVVIQAPSSMQVLLLWFRQIFRKQLRLPGEGAGAFEIAGGHRGFGLLHKLSRLGDGVLLGGT